MRTQIGTAMALTVLLTGCGDGVPKVTDPHNIIVEGQAMSQKNFLDRYCQGKTTEENCASVLRAMAQDSAVGKNGVTRF